MNLSSSDYDYLIIVFRMSTSHANHMSEFILKGEEAYANIAHQNGGRPKNIYRPIWYVDDTKLHADNCESVESSYVYEASTTNNWLVPVKVLGGKF